MRQRLFLSRFALSQICFLPCSIKIGLVRKYNIALMSYSSEWAEIQRYDSFCFEILKVLECHRKLLCALGKCSSPGHECSQSSLEAAGNLSKADSSMQRDCKVPQNSRSLAGHPWQSFLCDSTGTVQLPSVGNWTVTLTKNPENGKILSVFFIANGLVALLLLFYMTFAL